MFMHMYCTLSPNKHFPCFTTFLFKKCLLIFYFRWHWVLLLHTGFLWLRCAGFSLRRFSRCRAQALGCVGSVVVVPGLESTGSGVLEHGLSCSEACGIFLDKGSNPCPRHWQVSCQEDPCFSAFCLYVEIHFYAFEGQGHVPGYCPWWPGGQDSALSLLWPDLSLSPGTEILPQAAAG